MAGEGASMMGAGMGAIVGAMSDEWTANRNQHNTKNLMNKQFNMNEEMARRNQNRAKDMWEFTNYENQVKHMENAGLNKALMYGNGGGGGATTSGAEGSGVSPSPVNSTNAGTLMGMNNMMEMALMKAQKENIEADTANKRADAGYTSGAKTNNTDQDTNVKYQDEAQRALELSQRRKTADDEVLKVKAERIGQELMNLNTQQKTEESKAQVQKMAQDIAQGWQGLDLKAKEVKIKEFEAELKAKYPGLDAVAGGTMNNLVETLYQILGIQDNHKTIK